MNEKLFEDTCTHAACAARLGRDAAEETHGHHESYQHEKYLQEKYETETSETAS